jgi:hypothetical protein
MTKSSLGVAERRTVEIIEELGFGFILGLIIRRGLPCYETQPRIIQTIKLDSEPQPLRTRPEDNLMLKRQFERLFSQFATLEDARVDIEVQHGLPFKVVVERDRRLS